jgi:hypothetical protein
VALQVRVVASQIVATQDPPVVEQILVDLLYRVGAADDELLEERPVAQNGVVL